MNTLQMANMWRMDGPTESCELQTVQECGEQVFSLVTVMKYVEL